MNVQERQGQFRPAFFLWLRYPCISPTYLYSLEIIPDCDIVLISQVKNFPT